MVLGEFDFVGICGARDDAVMARYVLQLDGLGFVRTKTSKAFPETAYRELSAPARWDSTAQASRRAGCSKFAHPV